MSTAARALASLERHREDFRPAMTRMKLAALRQLVRARLRTAGEVRRLHEVLCFMRACPDSPALLRAVERLLTGFERRTDLRAHRDALADSGIAGTVMGYPFFYPTAHWISRRWPDALRLDRSDTIAGDLDAARQAMADADTAVGELTAATVKARAEAQAAVNQATEHARQAAASQAAALNEKLDAQLRDAEGRIEQARASAMGALHQVASATASAIVSRLTGHTPDSGRLDAAIGAALTARGR
jgi:F-type H+-transporting ATPase subunit b